MTPARKSKLKTVSLMLVPCSIVAILVAGCGGNKVEESSVQQGVDTPIIGPVDLNLVGFDNLDLQKLLQQKFPQIQFTFYPTNKPSLTELITAGTSIDLYMASYGAFGAPGNIISVGLHYDMADLIKRSKLDLSRFETSALEGIKGYGGHYGIPYSTNVFVINYNKELFDRFGIPYPKDGMTWDQMNDLSKKLTRHDSGKQYIGFVPLSLGHVFVANQLSLPYIDPKTGKASIGAAEWSEKWNKIFQTYFVNFLGQPEYKQYVKGNVDFGGAPLFEKQRVAAMIYSGASLNNKNIEDMNWDMVAAPTLPELPNVGFQPYPGYMAVTNTSKHKEVGMEIIKFLTSDEVQMMNSKKGSVTILKSDSIRKAYGQDSPSSKDKNLQAVFYNQFAAMSKATSYDQTVQRAYVMSLLPALAGETDRNTAFRNAAEAAEKAIEEMKRTASKTN